jgi:hypothetical protein
MFTTEARYIEQDEPTTELYIPTVLERTSCKNHDVPEGVPCFHIGNDESGYNAAVCNKRALRAGFNARISKSSLVRNHIKNRKGN